MQLAVEIQAHALRNLGKAQQPPGNSTLKQVKTLHPPMVAHQGMGVQEAVVSPEATGGSLQEVRAQEAAGAIQQDRQVEFLRALQDQVLLRAQPGSRSGRTTSAMRHGIPPGGRSARRLTRTSRAILSTAS